MVYRNSLFAFTMLWSALCVFIAPVRSGPMSDMDALIRRDPKLRRISEAAVHQTRTGRVLVEMGVRMAAAAVKIKGDTSQAATARKWDELGAVMTLVGASHLTGAAARITQLKKLAIPTVESQFKSEKSLSAVDVDVIAFVKELPMQAIENFEALDKIGIGQTVYGMLAVGKEEPEIRTYLNGIKDGRLKAGTIPEPQDREPLIKLFQFNDFIARGLNEMNIPYDSIAPSFTEQSVTNPYDLTHLDRALEILLFPQTNSSLTQFNRNAELTIAQSFRPRFVAAQDATPGSANAKLSGISFGSLEDKRFGTNFKDFLDTSTDLDQNAFKVGKGNFLLEHGISREFSKSIWEILTSTYVMLIDRDFKRQGVVYNGYFLNIGTTTSPGTPVIAAPPGGTRLPTFLP